MRPAEKPGYLPQEFNMMLVETCKIVKLGCAPHPGNCWHTGIVPALHEAALVNQQADPHKKRNVSCKDLDMLKDGDILIGSGFDYQGQFWKHVNCQKISKVIAKSCLKKTAMLP